MLQLIRLPSAMLRLPAARLFSTAQPSSANSQAATETATATQTSTAPFQKSTPPSFTINRTHSLNLPIYHRIRSGGAKKLTDIKKVEGDAHALADLITRELNLETKVNTVTNHITIKGLHRPQIEQWLTAKGF